MSTKTQPDMHRLYSVTDWNVLHAQARRQAQVLRREAYADFWHDANSIWSAGLATAQRSAQRLAHSLSRHAQVRGKSLKA